MWDNLKASIASIIKTNNNQEITGNLLQNAIFSIINNIGKNATFAGVAIPTTNPGTPDGPVCYLADQKGTYTNFGRYVFSQGMLVIFIWDTETGNWGHAVLRSDLMIDDNSITTDKIVNNAVTLSKINSNDIDNAPVLNSQKLVRSGGVKAAINYILSGNNTYAGKNMHTGESSDEYSFSSEVLYTGSKISKGVITAFNHMLDPLSPTPSVLQKSEVTVNPYGIQITKNDETITLDFEKLKSLLELLEN